MDSSVHAVPIPLDSLRLSPLNARRIGSKPLDDLAASILAEGLLQNLTVTENDAGEYEIVAGKRRFGALQLLRERGQLPAELHSVPCRIVHDGRAASASLAENIMREPMHAADEFEAFKRLADQGRSPEEIAQEFGTTPTVVLRRLKLASVAPSLFELFRKDEIRLDQMMALALTDDHKKQLAAWNVKEAWERNADRIRDRLMAAKEFRINADPAAKFVGADRMEAAGIIVRRDLFSDQGEGFTTDRKHVDELALELLEAEAEKERVNGWKWVEARIQFEYPETNKFSRIYPDYGRTTLSADESKRLEELNEQLEQLNEADQYDGEAAERIEAEIERLETKGEAWTEKQREAAGVIVHLSREGTVTAQRGLIRPGDSKPREAGEASRSGAKAKKKSTDISQPVVDRLVAQRTAMLQAGLLAEPRVALALLAHRLLLGFYFPDRAERSPMQIRYQGPGTLEAKASELPAMRYYNQAKDCLAAVRKTLPPASDLLGWLLQQPQEAIVNLIAAVASQAVDTTQSGDHIDRKSELAPVLDALELDFADHWEATPETFLSHVPRAVIEQTVREVCGAPALKNLEHLNKAQTVEAAAQLLADKRWLPKPLRRPKTQPDDDSAEKPKSKRKTKEPGA